MNDLYTFERIKRDSDRALQSVAERRFSNFTPKKRYQCIIKSHAAAPDFEMEVEATSRDEAVDYFLSHINRYGDWSRNDIAKHVSDGE